MWKKKILLLIVLLLGITNVYAKEITPEELRERAKDSNTDGLVVDNETDRVFYEGLDVNNFIKFNDELWRIMSIEPDGKIKIVYPNYDTATFGYTDYDVEKKIIWSAPVSYNTYLNGQYYNSLNSDKDYIVTGEFDIDKITGDLPWASSYSSSSKVSNYRTVSSSVWSGKVGILSLYEFEKAGDLDDNWLSDVTQYYSFGDYPSYYFGCFIVDTYFEPTTSIGPFEVEKPYYVWLDDSYGYRNVMAGGSNWYEDKDFGGITYQAVYLQTGLKLKGSGTPDDPYEITVEAKPEESDKKDNNIINPSTTSSILIMFTSLLVLLSIGLIYIIKKKKVTE